MGFLIGLVMGLGVGVTIAYFLTSQRTTARAAELQDLKRQLDLAESEHERRLREATTQLRQDYEAQLRAAQTPPAYPPQSVGEVSPAPVPRSERPSDSPQSPSPSTIEAVSPITATAPTPIPQPVQPPPAEPSPPVRDRPRSEPPPALETTDPHVLLAASYSPRTDTRVEVASAIAGLLSTSGAKAQARWMPVLGRLSRDAEPDVRRSAIQALQFAKSPKRLTLLQKALRDADPSVVETANAILSQLKGRSGSQPPSGERRLPKNR